MTYLLSSMPLRFNLFGDLAGEGEAARRAVRAWWPDVPSGKESVRFEHSPGGVTLPSSATRAPST